MIPAASRPPARPFGRVARRRTLLAILGALSLVALASTALVLAVSSRELRRDVDNRAALLAEIGADSLGPLLRDGEIAKARTMVEALTRDRDFASVALHDADGHPIIDLRAMEETGHVALAERTIGEGDTGRRRAFGHLRLELSYARIDRSLALFGGLLFGSSLLLIGAVLFGVLHRLNNVFGPMQRLTVAMRRIVAGDTDVAVDGVDRDDEVGEMARALTIFRDNSIEIVELRLVRERAMQAELNREREREAARMLAERNLALEDAKVAAEAANRSKSEFLANMSHELRTPLNAIIGFSEIIRDEALGPAARERYREYAGDIHRSGSHLLELINDLLDLSKIEAKGVTLKPQHVLLGPLVVEVAELLMPEARKSGVAIETLAPDETLAATADKLRLRQILLNLLSNAVKFTPAGGCVRIEASAPSLGWVALTVRDSGIGIAPEHMALVMQPFGQVDNVLTRTKPGTGLGLPLVKSLTEMQGGRFTLSSRVGEGTTARIELPRSGRPEGGAP